MRGLLSFFKHQPIVSAPPLLQIENVKDDHLPVPGNATPCAFSLQREVVYTICVVKERDGTSLLFQVLREIGKVSLAGLRAEAGGQLEMDGQLIPMQVERVSLPWISVATFPARSRPVQRQSLRIPTSFDVRFRGVDVSLPWQTGAGINISVGGFCFVTARVEPPALGTVYTSELTIHMARGQEPVLCMEVEVRWVSHTSKDTTVGVRVTNPARCKDLTSMVSQLQHLMSRQPDDYVLATNHPLHLH